MYPLRLYPIPLSWSLSDAESEFSVRGEKGNAAAVVHAYSAARVEEAAVGVI